MPGNISYKIEIIGLDESIIKLTKLNSLLNAISNKNGSANVNTSANGSGNINVNNFGNSKSSNAVESALLGGAAGGATSSSKYKSSLSELEAMLKTSQKQLFAEVEKIKEVPVVVSSKLQKAMDEAAKKLEEATSKIKVPRNNPAWTGNPPELNKNNTFEEDVAAHTEWYKSQHPTQTKSGPRIGPYPFESTPKPSGGLRDGFKKILESSGFGGIAQIGQSLFKLLGPILGISTAFLALKKVVDLLIEGLKHGTEAYLRAAKFGQTVQQSSNFSEAAKVLGVDSLDLAELQGQFNNKATKYNSGGTELGAGRANQFGQNQQLINLAKDFEAAMKDGAANARQMGEASRATYELNMNTSELSREWDTLLTQFVAMISPLIEFIEYNIKLLLEAENLLAEAWIWLEKILGLLPDDDSTKFKKTGGKGVTESFTSWERIGFTFNKNSGVENNIASTAKNTKDTVTSLQKLITSINTRNDSTYTTLPNYA